MHLLVYNMRNKSTNYYDPNTETIVFKKSERNVLPFKNAWCISNRRHRDELLEK